MRMFGSQKRLCSCPGPAGTHPSPGFSAKGKRSVNRILATLMLCALLPLLLLAGISLYQAKLKLREQACQQLEQAARNYALSVYEHLLLCEDELKLVGIRPTGDADKQRQKFDAIGCWTVDGQYVPILGDLTFPPALPTFGQKDLEAGKTIAVFEGGQPTRIVLMRCVHEMGGPTIVMGRIRGEYLWGQEKGNGLPWLTEAAILARSGEVLFQTPGWPTRAGANLGGLSIDGFQLHSGNKNWMAAHYPVALQEGFDMDGWKAMVIRQEAHVLTPIAHFKRPLLFSVVLAMVLTLGFGVFLLNHRFAFIQPNKNDTHPIAPQKSSLTAEAREGNKETPSDVRIDAPHGKLERQLKVMSMLAEIDRAALVARGFDHIARSSIAFLLKDFPFQMVAIGRLNADIPGEALLYSANAEEPQSVSHQPFDVDEKSLAVFQPTVGWKTFTDRTQLERYVPEKELGRIHSITCFPVFLKTRLHALLVVADPSITALPKPDLATMRNVADRLAAACSNANLIRNLRQLTIGAMHALARAADAKSSWTAGHSVRVQQISLNIAREMHLSTDGVERLRYGALLHDIGKLNIDGGLLDKPGKLTDEEFAIIREHPAKGNDILAPIGVLRDIIPIVRQHHERWDGKGYPDGLSGNAISLEARILAVANAYDAMLSDRPYRQRMEIANVLSVIEAETGRQFDPRVVAAFFKIMGEKAALAN